MINQKAEKLSSILSEMNSVLVAYSGGVDSTLLVKIALETLGPDRILAVTASSETYTAEDLEEAQVLAGQIGVRHRIVVTEELKDSRFIQNPPERCYYCKKELFGKLFDLAKEYNLANVVDGSNHDDLSDFRPGMKAGKEMGIRSPIQEAGLTKDEVRNMAKELGLPNWNKPSMPCLSSRFPYGTKITSEKLRQVSEAEKYLRSLDIGQLRVRHHEDTARIEVTNQAIAKIADNNLRKLVLDRLKELGFTYVTLDLQGFRSGSMNETLPKEITNG